MKGSLLKMAKEEKLEWIYKGANSLVEREEYLLGRKVDKTLEQLNEEEKEKKFVLPTPKNHVEHECIPPSIRDFNKIVQAEQVDMSAKLQEDPLIAIKKREEEARRQFLQNPVQLKKLQEALKVQETKKKKKKSSKLDKKIAEKLKVLKSSSSFKKEKKETLDTILMHKFNALKDKLTQDDLNDIMNGKIDSDSCSDEERKGKSESEDECKTRKSRNYKTQEQGKSRRDNSSDSSYEPIKRKKIKERSRSKEDHRKKEISTSRERRDSEVKGYKSSKRSRDKGDKKSKPKKRDRSKSKDKERDRKSRKKNKHNRSERSERKTRKETDNITHLEEESDAEKLADSDDELDAMILKKLKSLRGDADLDFEAQKTIKKNMLPEKLRDDGESSSSDVNSKSNEKQKIIGPDRGPEKPRTSSVSEDDENRYDSDSKNYDKPKKFGLVSAEGKKIKLRHDTWKKHEHKTNTKDKVPVKPGRSLKVAKRLTEEEKEKIRREMMMNATVRDKEREATVKKYKEQEEKEKLNTKKKYNKELVHNELVKSTRVSSVEERIKSNVNNIQRSSRHMDSHFTRR